MINPFGRAHVAIYCVEYILLLKLVGLWGRCAVQLAAGKPDRSVSAAIFNDQLEYTLLEFVQ